MGTALHDVCLYINQRSCNLSPFNDQIIISESEASPSVCVCVLPYTGSVLITTNLTSMPDA